MRHLIVALALLLALTAGFVNPANAAPATGGLVYTATARISLPAPAPNQKETVTGTLLLGGKPVAGATLTATWRYKTTTATCTAVTNAAGVAACSRDISRATPGYAVQVTLTFTRAGKVLATARTRFTPTRGGKG